MKITYDPPKRARTLTERGLDFADAAAVLAGPVFEFEDRRADYGEARIITIGLLGGRMVVVGWTPRGDVRPTCSRCAGRAGGSRSAMPTDFARLDATSEAEMSRHMAEDDVPDLADAVLEEEDGRRVWRGRRGRPRSGRTKVPVSIRLSREVLEAFRASGPGWQTRVDEALRIYLRDHPSTRPDGSASEAGRDRRWSASGRPYEPSSTGRARGVNGPR